MRSLRVESNNLKKSKNIFASLQTVSAAWQVPPG